MYTNDVIYSASPSNLSLCRPQAVLGMLQGALLLILALSAAEIRCWGWIQNVLLHPITSQKDLYQQRPRFIWSSKNLDYFDLHDEDRTPPNTDLQRDDDSRRPPKRIQKEGGGERDDGFVSMTKKGLANFQGPFSKALLAGIFVLGIGVGVTVDSAINTNPRSDTVYVVCRFAHLIL